MAGLVVSARRLLRGIAISRKDFLLVGSNTGGERAAILYTLIETAMLNGLDPEAHLAHAVGQFARRHLASKLSELLPWQLIGNRRSAAATRPRESQSASWGRRAGDS